MTVFSTPTTPQQLIAYRTRHTVRPVNDYDEDLGRMVEVCATDHIRVYPFNGRYIHDRSTIRHLAALERGEGIRW